MEHGLPILNETNWVNAATGLNGIPANGDIAIFDARYADSYKALGSDIANRRFGGFVYNTYSQFNQGCVTFQTGGPGVQVPANVSPYWNSECSIKGSGDFTVQMAYANTALQIQKNFSAESGVTLSSAGTGPGDFCIGRARAPSATARGRRRHVAGQRKQVRKQQTHFVHIS